jgi:hypothetical protein
MTLTVRLDDTLTAALERYCAATGATKSLVVQESLANYLLADQAKGASERSRGAAAQPPAPVSANFKAFADAGFIGAGELRGGSADKAAVRAKALQRIRRASE